jgi:hypothetical protein
VARGSAEVSSCGPVEVAASRSGRMVRASCFIGACGWGCRMALGPDGAPLGGPGMGVSGEELDVINGPVVISGWCRGAGLGVALHTTVRPADSRGMEGLADWASW